MNKIQVNNITVLHPKARRFIAESIQMFKNNFTDFSYTVEPKTAKSFILTVTLGENSITEKFKASDIKGSTGVFKLAKIVSQLGQNSEGK